VRVLKKNSKSFADDLLPSKKKMFRNLKLKKQKPQKKFLISCLVTATNTNAKVKSRNNSLRHVSQEVLLPSRLLKICLVVTFLRCFIENIFKRHRKPKPSLKLLKTFFHSFIASLKALNSFISFMFCLQINRLTSSSNVWCFKLHGDNIFSLDIREFHALIVIIIAITILINSATLWYWERK
jgi:hypothetical protein